MRIIPKVAITATAAVIAASGSGAASPSPSPSGSGGSAGGTVGQAGQFQSGPQAIGPIGPIIPAPPVYRPRPRSSYLIVRNGGGRSLAQLEVRYCGCSHRQARDWAWQIQRTHYKSWTGIDGGHRGPILVRVAG